MFKKVFGALVVVLALALVLAPTQVIYGQGVTDKIEGFIDSKVRDTVNHFQKEDLVDFIHKREHVDQMDIYRGESDELLAEVVDDSDIDKVLDHVSVDHWRIENEDSYDVSSLGEADYTVKLLKNGKTLATCYVYQAHELISVQSTWVNLIIESPGLDMASLIQDLNQ